MKHFLNELGNEFFLLREAETSDITAVSSENIADAITCLRQGKVRWNPGFDGQVRHDGAGTSFSLVKF